MALTPEQVQAAIDGLRDIAVKCALFTTNLTNVQEGVIGDVTLTQTQKDAEEALYTTNKSDIQTLYNALP